MHRLLCFIFIFPAICSIDCLLDDIFVVYGDDPGGECLVHPRRSCEDGIIVNQQGVQDEHNFYGTTPNITSVCKNGIIVFDNSSDACNVTGGPTTPAIIAFWDNVTLTANEVHYFNSTATGDNYRNKFAKRYFTIKTYLQKGFGITIDPTRIFVATWIYDTIEFQIVLGTVKDEPSPHHRVSMTYALLIYKRGWIVTREQREMIGFHAGETMYTRLTEVESNFADGSNIGISGVYAYRIDGERIFEPVSCGNLSDPENGRVHYDSTSLESVAVYTCNDFCEANLTIRACCNGSWSGEEPKCAESSTPSSSESPTSSPSVSLTSSPSVSPTSSPSVSPTSSPSVSLTSSPSVSLTSSPSVSLTSSPSVSLTSSPSVSLTSSPSMSLTPSPSVSLTSSPSVSLTPSPSVSLTSSPSVSLTLSPSVSLTLSPSVSLTLSPSMSPTPSVSFTSSPTMSPTPTVLPPDISLVNGNKTSGLVEVYYDGKWKSVCDDYWTEADANVACGHLGFLSYGANATTQGSFMKDEPVKYWLDNVVCVGNEESLFECPRRGRGKTIGYHNCRQRERAGVHCLNKSDEGIRFADWGDEGIIELSIRGEWRSVCDNFWSKKDAEVACRQLGCSYTNATPVFGDRLTPWDKENYWLDYVRCEGNEDSLFACQHSGIGRHSCGPGKSARVNCA